MLMILLNLKLVRMVAVNVIEGLMALVNNNGDDANAQDDLSIFLLISINFIRNLSITWDLRKVGFR